MNILKRILNIFLNLVILAAIIFFVIEARNIFSNIQAEFKNSVKNESEESKIAEEIVQTKEEISKNLPMPEGAVEKVFAWQYGGKKYSISQNLYLSIYDFYKSQPKSYTYFNELPVDWEEEYYGMFIAKNEKYDFARELLNSIIVQGQKNNLSEDQLVELVLAFVQAIPYDDQKAANILSRSATETMNYPYETIFENKGVCSDKSFLAVSLLRELGYGTALFVYEGQNHMAIGIQCPMQYSNYQSGYCYGETTSVGNKIGIIPELKAYAGKAVGNEEISYFTESGNGFSQMTKLGEVKIFQKTSGKEYGGIVQTIKTNNEINSLKNEIASISAKLKEMKSDIGDMKEGLDEQRKKLNQYLENNDIEKYNEKAEEYNKDFNDYEDLVKDYNRRVKIYNEKVARYNYLIKL